MNSPVINTIVADTNGALQNTWFLLPNWKWIALVSLGVAGFLLVGALRPAISKSCQLIRRKFAPPSYGYYLLEQPLHRPLSWLFVCLLLLFGWEALALPDSLEKALRILTQIVLSVACLRLSYMMVEALGQKLDVVVKKTESTLDDQLAPLATKTIKVVIVLLGFLIILQNFGVNVVSLLAGLGLGGLALALAAQDTIANLFGSVTIIMDRPFQVGQFIKVGDTEGVVEELGFRSTRIRTPYQSLVSIPNSIMAKEKIDNMGLRPRRRLRHLIGLTYDAEPAQIEAFCDRVRYYLLQHPEVYRDDMSVVFHSFGDSSINILLNCFAVAPTIEKELEIQQQILFEVMMAAKESGVGFAFPTRTVHLASVPAVKPTASS